MKKCSKCGQTKPLNEYYTDRGRVTASCKVCVKAERAAHRAANPERVKEVNARSRERFREQNRQRQAQWHIDNPEMTAYHAHKQRARRRNIEWQFTFETWLEWWGDDYARRGAGPDDLCCARRGDTGPYSPENCVKLTISLNSRHARRREAVAKIAEAG